MQITLYNALSRKKEILKPIRKDWVGVYTCGPTVYSFVHIGNLRTFVFEDVLRRSLEYGGYKVRHVMNITDVEDKIIRDAKAAGKDIYEFTRPYEESFFADLEKLHIEKAWKYPRATEHIKEMVALINKLLKKDIAYKANDSVYFAISKFPNYGKLSRIKARTLKVGARVDNDEYAKQDVQDFVLWKGKKDDEPSWPAPFSDGRPGWHIECSAMSMKYLGEAFDIHAGGIDLLFPHHENEIAQSEAATGKKFVNIFAEGEHLLVNGEKMSKSLGNVFSLRDIEAKGVDPLVFRYLALSAHYRSKLNFTWESLDAAQQSLRRLYDFANIIKGNFSTIRQAHGGEQSRTTSSKNKNNIVRVQSPPAGRAGRTYLEKYKTEFDAAIANDLDMPKALATVWKLIHEYNKNPSKYDSKDVLKLLYDFDKVLGFGLKKLKEESVPHEVIEMAHQREEFRKEKNWSGADTLREQIREFGYLVEDSADGPKIKKA